MTHSATVARFFEALRERDFAEIGSCFEADTSFRALTPMQLRELVGADEVAARYEYWFSRLEPFELLEAEAVPIADRVRLRYVVRGRHPEHGWWINEHTAYARMENDRIAEVSLTCTGFRPTDPPTR